MDAKTHLIAAFEVTNHANDQQVLSAFSQKVKQDQRGSKGIQKTSAEAGLSFLAFFPRLQPQWKKGQQGAKRVGGEAVAYNMKRAINMKGVPALVEAMRGI